MDKPMQLLVLVLNKVDCLDTLLEELLEIGVKGATVIESTGMGRALADSSKNLFGSIRMLMDPDLESNRTVFIAVNNDLVETVRETVDRVVDGLGKPDTGVLFGLPISFFDGVVPKR